MAEIDHRILLAGEVPDTSRIVGNALLTGQRFRQAREEQPLRNRLLEAQTERVESTTERDEALFQLQDATRDAMLIRPALTSGDIPEVTRQLQNRIEKIQARGGNPQDSIALLERVRAGDFQGALRDVDAVINASQQFASSTPAGIREFQAMIQAAQSDDPLVRQAARVDLGVEPRAGISAQERIAKTPGRTEEVAESQATIAGARGEATERGKLAAQLELAPEVEAAVTAATESAKQSVAQAGEERSNATALDLWNTALGTLESSLEGTETGPIVGRLPAITANAQIANGAVAAMAPILKQLFRAAGEGVFTDRDQQLLLEMIPTRVTLPAARDAQLRAIDSIVRAKLGEGTEGTGAAFNVGEFTVEVLN